MVEYRFLVIQHSIQIHGRLIALLFAVPGIWLGLKPTKNKETVIREVPASQFFTLNETRLRKLGITRRELEILDLIADGLSNREIAEKFFSLLRLVATNAGDKSAHSEISAHPN